MPLSRHFLDALVLIGSQACRVSFYVARVVRGSATNYPCNTFVCERPLGRESLSKKVSGRELIGTRYNADPLFFHDTIATVPVASSNRQGGRVQIWHSSIF